MKEDSFRFDPTNNVGHLITSTTLLEIKSMAKDTLTLSGPGGGGGGGSEARMTKLTAANQKPLKPNLVTFSFYP